jgi:hypothetical protein
MLQVANCLSPSAAKNDNESCLRHFEHLCRGLSSSSEERLLGEGEDILNGEWRSWTVNEESLNEEWRIKNEESTVNNNAEGKEITQQMAAAGSLVVFWLGRRWAARQGSAQNN